MKYITDPTLQMGMQIVMGYPNKLDNFKLCQQYLSTPVMNTEQQCHNKHNVSKVSGEAQVSNNEIERPLFQLRRMAAMNSVLLEETLLIMPFVQRGVKPQAVVVVVVVADVAVELDTKVLP